MVFAYLRGTDPLPDSTRQLVMTRGFVDDHSRHCRHSSLGVKLNTRRRDFSQVLSTFFTSGNYTSRLLCGAKHLCQKDRLESQMRWCRRPVAALHTKGPAVDPQQNSTTDMAARELDRFGLKPFTEHEHLVIAQLCDQGDPLPVRNVMLTQET